MKKMIKIQVSFIVPFLKFDKNVKKIINEFKKNNKRENQLILICDGKKKVTIKKKLNSNIIIKNLNSCSGPGLARNRGIQLAKHSFIQFLDDDDMFDFKKLRLMNLKVNPQKFNIISYNFFSNDKWFKKNKKKFVKNFSKNKIELINKFFRLESHYSVIHYFFNKNFLIKNKIRFSRYYFEDILFLLKVIIKNNKKNKHINKILYYKKFKKDSITGRLTNRKTYNKSIINQFLRSWFNCLKILKLNSQNTSNYNSLSQIALRGLLGYLIKNNDLKKLENTKNFLKLKTMIKKFNNPIMKYDKITFNYLKQ